jgi:hypothetical protein
MKTNKAKQDRKKCKFDQLHLDEQVAKKERSKREVGAYKTGMNMAAGAVDRNTINDLLQTATVKPTPTNQRAAICPHYLLKGHTTIRSKKCLKNPARILAATTVALLTEATKIRGYC